MRMVHLSDESYSSTIELRVQTSAYESDLLLCLCERVRVRRSYTGVQVRVLVAVVFFCSCRSFEPQAVCSTSTARTYVMLIIY